MSGTAHVDPRVAFFQPIGDRRAIVNGDIVMTADAIQAVIRALRENDIQAFSLHTHMLYGRPRLFYMHLAPLLSQLPS